LTAGEIESSDPDNVLRANYTNEHGTPDRLGCDRRIRGYGDRTILITHVTPACVFAVDEQVALAQCEPVPLKDSCCFLCLERLIVRVIRIAQDAPPITVEQSARSEHRCDGLRYHHSAQAVGTCGRMVTASCLLTTPDGRITRNRPPHGPTVALLWWATPAVS
jgi:hypothetical protein